MKQWIHLLMGFCLLFTWSINGFAKASNSTVPVADNLQIQMVDSGYTMGDQLVMQATFTLAKGEKVDPDSLPLAGRVRPWLDIVHVDVAQAGQTVTLSTVWQLFATVEIAQQLSTPLVVLKTLGTQAHPLQIPPQSFYYSPVLPLPPIKDIKRRPNQAPPAFDTSTPMLQFWACTVLFVLLLLLWAWVRDALPWLPFKPGPMTRLARSLRSAALQNTALDQTQLKAVHQALCASAGENLYADDLTPLFIKAPYFKAVQANVVAFIQDAWQHFYAPTQVQAIQANAVYPWVKRMAIAERLYRKQRHVSDD